MLKCITRQGSSGGTPHSVTNTLDIAILYPIIVVLRLLSSSERMGILSIRQLADSDRIVSCGHCASLSGLELDTSPTNWVFNANDVKRVRDGSNPENGPQTWRSHLMARTDRYSFGVEIYSFLLLFGFFSFPFLHYVGGIRDF